VFSNLAHIATSHQHPTTPFFFTSISLTHYTHNNNKMDKMDNQEGLDELDEGLDEYKQSKNKYINISQTIALYGVSGFFAGFSFGGSNAIVNNQSVISYALRTGGNCFVIGALVGGINESLAAVRGTRDPINPAIACGFSGFLASVQRAPTKRAGLVGLLCASAGVFGHYGWEEASKRYYIRLRERRIELGLEVEDVVPVIESEALRLPNRQEQDENIELGLMRWAPVRPISDKEIEERRRVDRKVNNR